MSDDQAEDERLAKLIKRVRPPQDQRESGYVDRDTSRWTPAVRRRRRTVTLSWGRDGSPQLRGTD